ncbi:MAG: prealbumin-like fold domain-containing protein [Thomasclavelia ramosa]
MVKIKGIYITNQNGQIIIDKLPMGSYLISEVKTLPDMYLMILFMK